MKKDRAMEIKIKYHNSELEKLRSLSVGDWIDLRAAERVELKAGEFRLISLGVSMKLPEGYEAHIAPRSSSFAKWGFLQVNSVGVVDNSYAGTNDIWKLPVYATRDAVIEVNDRICQFRIMERMPQIIFTEVDALDDADRGGFGSTGVR
jgi:dUTP pyrophosphatase